MMTESDGTTILTILKAAYPNSYKDLTKREAAGIINVWRQNLSDAPAEVVMLAVRRLITKSKFPPTIAEVRSQIVALRGEAESVVQQRQSQMLKLLSAIKGDSPSDIPDRYTELEVQAKSICEMTRGFNAELSLAGLLNSNVIDGDLAIDGVVISVPFALNPHQGEYINRRVTKGEPHE